MHSRAETVEEYIDTLPQDRKEAMIELRNTILKNLPKGFMETMSYGMIGYVVPHTIYPDGYHCDPDLPLPFLSIASQKNFVAVYHMGIYSDKKLLEWFMNEYVKQTDIKLDMGKSCMRFKKMEQIPYKVIGDLVKKMSVNDWIDVYESNIKR